MSAERLRQIWAFRRTRLLGGRTGFVTVAASIAAEAIKRGFASANYSDRLRRDPPNAPFADEDPRDRREVIRPMRRDAEGKLTTAEDTEAAPKRKPGRPRKNPAA